MNTLQLPESVVSIGSTVAVRDLESNEIDVYTLVAPNHADIAANRISSMTPIAHALYGRQAGDVVDVAAPAGIIQLRIESIHRRPLEEDYG
jgi:transcription elongation GreA/GreB family factor